MKPRLLIFAALLVALSSNLALPGSRRPGARAPVGPPPGSVPAAHSNNDISAHLDRTTKHLERLLRQGDSTAPSSTGSNVSKSATGVVPGSNAANQSTPPASPHHLIGDPPLPSSITELSILNTSPVGNRRPGARPPVYPAPYLPPHHLIGDPPTWPDDLGTYFGSSWDPGDDRGLLPGEINIYTGTLNSYGARYWQTVFNWNPTSGFGRSVYWSFGPPSDPSQVDYYYYAPAPPPPPPPPAPAPAATSPAPIQNNNPSVPPNPNDPHIYLAAGPVNQSTGLPSTQGGDAAISPISGQSSNVQTAAESSNVTYYAGSGYPDNSVSGQIASSIGFSPDDFTDDSYAVASLPANGTTQGVQEDNPSSGIDPVSAGIADSGEFDQSSEPPSAAEIAPSAQGQAQSYLTPSDPEGAAPVGEESPSPESGDVSVAQTDSGSTSRGSGSAWPLGLAGLLIGAGVLAGARKAISWNQDEADPLDSVRVWIEPSPPSPEQRQSELNPEVASEINQPAIQTDQQPIQDDTLESQQAAQSMPQVPSKLQQDQQSLQQTMQMLEQEKPPLLKVDDQVKQERRDESEYFTAEQQVEIDIQQEPWGYRQDEQMLQLKQQEVQQEKQFLQQDELIAAELSDELETLEDEGEQYDRSEDIPDSLQEEWNQVDQEAESVAQAVDSLPGDIGTLELNIDGLQQSMDSEQNSLIRGPDQYIPPDPAPDPNGGWDPSSDPLSPAPANDPEAPGPPANDPSDPNQGWDTATDPLSPCPANPDQSPQAPDDGSAAQQEGSGQQDTSGQQDSSSSAPPAQPDDSGNNQGNLAYQDPSVPLTYDQGYGDGKAWALDPNRGPGPPLVLNPDYLNGFGDGVESAGAPTEGVQGDPLGDAATVALALVAAYGIWALRYAMAMAASASVPAEGEAPSLWQRVVNYLLGQAPTAENRAATSAENAIPDALRLTESEQATAARLMNETGLELTESPHVGAEFVDQFGRTYDAMGTPSASQYWNASDFFDSITRHLLKSNDFTVIDLTGFTAEQISAVRDFIGGLSPELQAKIIQIGF